MNIENMAQTKLILWNRTDKILLYGLGQTYPLAKVIENLFVIKNQLRRIISTKINQCLINLRPKLGKTHISVIENTVLELDEHTSNKMIFRSELHELLARYFILRTTPELSEANMTKLEEIGELALIDEELSAGMGFVDAIIYKLEDNQITINHPTQQYDISQFLQEIHKLEEHKTIQSGQFKQLCQKIVNTRELIEQHIGFRDHYSPKLILQTDNVKVSVISWKSNQKTELHQHDYGYGYGYIYVYRGNLCVNQYSVNAKDPSDIKCLGEGEWLYRPAGIEHKLGNNSDSKDLVTIHFYYKPQNVDKTIQTFI